MSVVVNTQPNPHQIFSANPTDIMGKSFFQSVEAARYSTDPVIRAKYHDSIKTNLNVFSLFEAWVGYDDYCPPGGGAWEVLRYGGYTNKITLANSSAIVIAAGATSAAIPINVANQLSGSGNILPQVGGHLILGTPELVMFKVTAVGVTSGTPTVTLQNITASSKTIVANAEALVSLGKEWEDCTCPENLPTLGQEPLVELVDFMQVDNALKFCGKQLLDCKRPYKYKVMVVDENGMEVEVEHTIDESLILERRNHEQSIGYKAMFFDAPSTHPNRRGVVPQIKNKAIRWTLNSATEIADIDFEELKTELTEKGISCKKFMVIAGSAKMILWQNYFNSKGLGRVLYGNDAVNACGDPSFVSACNSLNLNFKVLQTHGLTFVVVEDDILANSFGFGIKGSDYKNREILIPMQERSGVCNNRSQYDMNTNKTSEKPIQIVYRKDRNGRVYDRFSERTGHGTERNFNKAGCTDYVESIQTHFAVEVHDVQCWILEGWN